MKPVLLIDAYLMDPGGAPFFRPLLAGAPIRTVRVLHDPIPSLDDVGAVVVTGSAASVNDDLPWVRSLVTTLREAVASDVPVLGVCFGHQALAAAVAGPLAVRRRAEAEVGHGTVWIDAQDPLLSALGSPIQAFLSHEDEVVWGSAGLEVLGRSALCDTQAIRVPGRRAWGVQFHLEYPLEEQARILSYRADRHPALNLRPDRLMADAPDLGPSAAALFARFLELAC